MTEIPAAIKVIERNNNKQEMPHIDNLILMKKEKCDN